MVEGPVPDTAMDTKSEDGEPGGESDSTPLTDEERAMLDRLRRAGGPAQRPQDESPEAAEADTTLPGAPPRTARPDPLDPIFREPNP